MIEKIAVKALGKYAETLVKVGSKDKGLQNAIMAMADAQIRQEKYIDSHWNEDSEEDLGTRVNNSKSRLEELRAKIKEDREKRNKKD